MRKLHWFRDDKVLAALPGPKNRDPLQTIYNQHAPGPERARRVVKELKEDAALIPFARVGAPAPMAEAAEAFRISVERALAAVDALEQAGAGTMAARSADVQAAAKAIRAGKAQPRELQVTQARASEEAALIGLEAAELACIETHADLTDAMVDNWAAWRRGLVELATRVDAEAKAATEKLAHLLNERREALDAVLRLDEQVTSRYRDVRSKVRAETRHGIKPFVAAVESHFYSPEIDLNHFRHTVEPALATITAHLAAETPWLSEWAPSGDPEHDALIETELDVDAAWVRKHLLPKNLVCPDCGRKLPEDAKIDPKTLRAVHECKSLMGRRQRP